MASVLTLESPPITPSDRLGVTVFFAICAHLVVVLGVTFVKQERALSPANTLDVVLVQRKSESAPEKADFLGQANQEGGGASEDANRPSSPLPSPIVSNTPDVAAAAPPLTPSAEVIAPPTQRPSPPDKELAASPTPAKPVVAQSAVETESRVARASESVPDLTRPNLVASATKATVVRKKPPKVTSQERQRKKPSETPQPRQKTLPAPAKTIDAASLVRRSLAMASLSAEVDRRLDAYAKRPRRKWVSASTRQHRYAAYMEAWRSKVERVGNLNYPDEARRRQLSGNLLLDVALRADGSVERITVRRSSGHKVLDDAAVRIVRLAAPFARLPKSIRQETDILHIQRTWRFLSSHRFASR
jgi:protein TonB